MKVRLSIDELGPVKTNQFISIHRPGPIYTEMGSKCGFWDVERFDEKGKRRVKQLLRLDTVGWCFMCALPACFESSIEAGKVVARSLVTSPSVPSNDHAMAGKLHKECIFVL